MESSLGGKSLQAEDCGLLCFYQRAALALRWSLGGICPRLIQLMEAFGGQKDMGTQVIEVTEFDSGVRFDLRGCLEAAVASEATQMAVIGNMHMDTRVIEVADFKSEVNFDL